MSMFRLLLRAWGCHVWEVRWGDGELVVNNPHSECRFICISPFSPHSHRIILTAQSTFHIPLENNASQLAIRDLRTVTWYFCHLRNNEVPTVVTICWPWSHQKAAILIFKGAISIEDGWLVVLWNSAFQLERHTQTVLHDRPTAK